MQTGESNPSVIYEDEDVGRVRNNTEPCIHGHLNKRCWHRQGLAWPQLSYIDMP